MNYREKGAALVIVLIISMLLTSFALYFSMSLKRSLNSAHLILNQSLAEQMALDTIAEISFHTFAYKNPEAKINKDWNLWGEPFNVGKSAVVKIKDLGATLSILPFHTQEWRAYLSAKSIPKEKVDKIIDEFIDWNDKDSFRRINGKEIKDYLRKGKIPPRDNHMQFVSEIKHLDSIDGKLFDEIRDDLIYFGASVRTPKYASLEMQSHFLKAGMITEIEELKLQQNFHLFEQLDLFPGLKNGDVESIQNFSSDTLLLNIEVMLGDSRATRKLILFAVESENRPLFYGSVE